MITDEQVARFAKLFSGLDRAFGTGAGRWIKRSVTLHDYRHHLEGIGVGIGIAPLRPDSTVLFAAIDLDEPDFDAAREMQGYIPGVSWIEKSRSGNAHIWCFFADPIEAWIPMALLREATEAAGKEGVEVFPKNHNFANVKLGNYINLPFHNGARPIISSSLDVDAPQPTFEQFLDEAESSLNDPHKWRTRATWMQLSPPERKRSNVAFGSRDTLHCCAQYVVENEIPIRQGTRSVAFFNLAKMFTNCSAYTREETIEIMRAINGWSDSIDDRELLRIINNAEQGEYTSTGCTEALFEDYRSPNCHLKD